MTTTAACVVADLRDPVQRIDDPRDQTGSVVNKGSPPSQRINDRGYVPFGAVLKLRKKINLSPFFGQTRAVDSGRGLTSLRAPANIIREQVEQQNTYAPRSLPIGTEVPVQGAIPQYACLETTGAQGAVS